MNGNHKHGHGLTLQRIKQKAKNTPGMIYIERRMHDEAVVVSGLLTVVTGDKNISGSIAKELETAARDISELGGIIGHIKATASTSSTEMISVTDADATVKESPERKVQIALAAIVFTVEQKTAEDIIRQALARIRKGS